MAQPDTPTVRRYGHEVAAGRVSGVSDIHKFGRVNGVGTSYAPLCIGGIYRTLQPAAATTLRIKAGGNAADTAAGLGAREVTLEMIDETGALVTEALATNGTGASLATTVTAIRLVRAYVSSAGFYATQAQGSHAADIVIEDSGGTADWATILVASFPRAQSQIGVYTVPLGFTGYMEDIILNVDGNQSGDIFLFSRENILEAAAPYSPMRSKMEITGLTGQEVIPLDAPLVFPALTDVGFMGKAGTGTTSIGVDFLLTLEAA